jgi:hypothetical protein
MPDEKQNATSPLSMLAQLLLAQLVDEARQLGVTPERLFMLKLDPDNPVYRSLKAAPPSAVAGILEDAHKGMSQSQSQLPPSPPQAPPEERGTGWVHPPQVEKWKAPGIDIIDRMCPTHDRVQVDMYSYDLQRRVEEAQQEEERENKESDPIGHALYEDPSKA